MTKVNNNKDNLISAIAFIEDISRSSNMVHEMLINLMNNPGDLTNIKTSIDNLHEKITNLKNSDMELPLIEEEVAVVPNFQDISPKRDVGLGIVNAPQPTPETEEETTPETEEETTPEIELVEELPTKVRGRRRKSTTKLPFPSKRSSQPRKDNQ